MKINKQEKIIHFYRDLINRINLDISWCEECFYVELSTPKKNPQKLTEKCRSCKRILCADCGEHIKYKEYRNRFIIILTICKDCKDCINNTPT